MSFKNFFSFMFMGFKVALRYRFGFMVTLITTPISILIYYFLWKAVYAFTGQTVIRGYSFHDLVGYYVVSMIVGLFIWIDIDKWIAEDIRKGQLVVDLLRPFGYIWQSLSFEIGINLFAVIIQLVPVFLIGFLFFGLRVAGFWVFVAFFLSLAFGFLIAFLISFLVGLTAFWFKKTSGLRRVRRALSMFLSGGLIPLSFFPLSFQKVFHFLPFEYMRFVPINIYLGKYSFYGVVFQLFLQFVWVLVLFFFAIFSWKSAVKKFSGEGT